MKKGLLLPVMMLVMVSLKAQQTPASADEILKEAYAQAGSENKNVFIIFHASWCGWCRKMDKSMEDTACKKLFDDSYVIRHLVVNESKDKKHLENPGAAELLKKHNGEGAGIPYWLVFEKDGNLLSDSRMRKEKDGPQEGDNTGCPATEKEVDFFISVLKKTTSLSSTELAIIRQRFRENDK